MSGCLIGGGTAKVRTSDTGPRSPRAHNARELRRLAKKRYKTEKDPVKKEELRAFILANGGDV